MSRVRRVLLAGALTAFVGGSLTGCGDDRPSDDAWRIEWETQRDAFPSADELLAGGLDGCGELLGRLRVELDELRPTPSAEIDDAFEAWAAHVETIAFECPDDAADLAQRYRELDVLASEIDAGLAAES